MSQLSAPGLLSVELALQGQVQALLRLPEVGEHEDRADAACDFLLTLTETPEVEAVLRAFSELRRACGPVAYLPLFRLRRWLEAAVECAVGERSWAPAELLDVDFDRSVRRMRARVWEMELGYGAPEDVPVEFRWRPAPRPA